MDKPSGGTNMLLDAWAQQWAISEEALKALRVVMGCTNYNTNADRKPEGKSEAWAQQRVRLEASKVGARLWRNNVGVLFDEDGRPIRYGLANDSKALNIQIKSSDLIGILPATIRPEDTGKTIGIFTSIEIKKPGWKYTGKDREAAQLAWINLIVSLGGIAAFSTGNF